MTRSPTGIDGGLEARSQVSAIIVRWRGGALAERCVRSLLELSHPGPHEIVVVDSGSGDGGAQRIAEIFPAVKVEAIADNVGFAAAANRGVSLTTSPLILLLNPDTEFIGNDLATLAARLLDEPGLAGIVPLLVGCSGRTQHRWQLRRLPTTFDLALGRPGRPAFLTLPTSTRPVAQPAAAAWLIRRTVWRALDGLDEGFSPAWWEDVDFCRRLAARSGTAGFPAERGFAVEPRARVLHRGGSSLGDLGADAFRIAYNGNLLRYAERHHAGSIHMIRFGLRVSQTLRRWLRTGRP